MTRVSEYKHTRNRAIAAFFEGTTGKTKDRVLSCALQFNMSEAGIRTILRNAGLIGRHNTEDNGQ